ncbi:MAG: flagellar biosynthetic protein FliR [Bdellovibrionales bacterium]|nr:flagellar biosynthetic protein FliR [Bdellovibrionales bacterium]
MNVLFASFDIVFLAYATRALGFFALLPFDSFNKELVTKLLLATACGLYFRVSQISTVEYTGSLWLEPIVGVLLAIPLFIVLEIAGSLGELIDQGRGQTIGSFYDPTLGLPQSTLSRLFRWGTWACILQSGIVEVSLGHLWCSLQVLDTSQLAMEAVAHLSFAALQFALDLLALGFSFFLPFCCLFLLIDILVGMLGKLAPQISLQAESFQLKTLLSFGIVIVLCKLAPLDQGTLTLGLADYLSLLEQIAAQLRP